MMLYKTLLLVAVNFIAAVTYPLGKLSFNYANPFFITGIRMVIAGILLTAFSYLYFGFRFKINKSFIVLFCALAFLNVFFTNALQFWALDHTSSNKAIMIFNMSPFIAAIFSYFLYGEKMTLKKMFALIIAFGGFLPILIFTPDRASPAFIPAISSAELALLIAAVASVMGWLIMKKIIETSRCSILMANGLSMIAGGLLFFPLSWYTEGPAWYTISNFYMVTVLTLVLIIANNIINYNAYAYFLKYLSATFLFLLSFSGPLFALFFGWLFLRETISLSFIISIIIVGIGLFMYYQEEKKIERIE